MRVSAGVLAVLCVVAAAPAVQAQSYSAFGFKPPADLIVPAFSDEEVSGLLTILDSLVASPTPTPPERPSAGAINDALWQFGRRLQTGRLSAPQEAKVLAHLDGLVRANAGLGPAVAGTRRVIEQLTVGKRAPDIVGSDLTGHPFKLSDYRGKIVALVFSAEWCAICRTQAPYERFLLGRYERWPFALLSVQTGSDREAAQAAFLADHLAHRAWWDAPADGDTNGPIADAWNVIGWPATYVIDGTGVIRFVNVRDEDLLKAVRQLVDEQVSLDDKARRAK
jgi:peroxiredoxin